MEARGTPSGCYRDLHEGPLPSGTRPSQHQPVRARNRGEESYPALATAIVHLDWLVSTLCRLRRESS